MFPNLLGILLLNGENDTATPVQQAFLFQQRLTDVNHPDHTLITYPNLGHGFYPASQWSYCIWTYTAICINRSLCMA